MSAGRVVLFKGHSLYEGTRTFIDEIAAAFQRRGFLPDVVDLAGVENVEAAIESMAGPPTALVYSINILGEHRDRFGRTISEIFRAPHVVWYVDYPLSLASRLRSTPPTTSLLVVDPTHVDALSSIFGPEQFACIAFCPHAAVGDPAIDSDVDAFAAREIPVLWSGGLVEPGEPAWASQPPLARRIFDDAVDLALSVEWMSPLQALDASLMQNGLDPSDPRLRSSRCDARAVDLRVRLLRRAALADRLVASGLPLTICGQGWQARAEQLRGASWIGPVSMPEAVKLMRRARVVISTNANFGAGSHERPLTALLAGAAAFSDYSAFYAGHFMEGREIALYRWRRLDAAMEQLTRLVADPETAFEIGRHGGSRVALGHRWDHRIDTILAAADASRERL